MFRTIGKVLLVTGLLATVGTAIWGWNNAVFNFSQTGTALGLRRLFFYLLYLPIPMSVAAVGLVLTFRDRMARTITMRKIALVISILLFLFAMSFVAFNVMSNIMHYEGEDVLKVVTLNFVFTLPILFLSGLLFFSSRAVSRD